MSQVNPDLKAEWKRTLERNKVKETRAVTVDKRKLVYVVCRVHRHRSPDSEMGPECPNVPEGMVPVHVFKDRKIVMYPRSANPAPYTGCENCSVVAMYTCGPESKVNKDWKPAPVRLPKDATRWGPSVMDAPVRGRV